MKTICGADCGKCSFSGSCGGCEATGGAVKFLDDKKIYLGTQIAFADRGVCYGVVADTTFILICRYSLDGSAPELVAYRKR